MATAMKVAAVLLVAGLSSQLLSVEAGLTGIKGLFRDHAAKNYVILAEHLHKATQSSELAENTKAAESLRSGNNEDLVKLVDAFKSLQGSESDLEVVCSKTNLANMRLVAETASAGGNLDKKNAEPVRRLNLLVVELIAYARAFCPAHLDAKWPNPWNPKFFDKEEKNRVMELSRAATSLLYKPDAAQERHLWGSALSYALTFDEAEERYALKNMDTECKDPMYTLDKSCLTHQLSYHVYAPCQKFLEVPEARDVLATYGDLLTSWFAIKDHLNTEDLARQDRYYDYNKYNKNVRQLALSYGVCERIVSMPVNVVVDQVRKSRKADKKQQQAN